MDNNPNSQKREEAYTEPNSDERFPQTAASSQTNSSEQAHSTAQTYSVDQAYSSNQSYPSGQNPSGQVSQSGQAPMQADGQYYQGPAAQMGQTSQAAYGQPQQGYSHSSTGQAVTPASYGAGTDQTSGAGTTAYAQQSYPNMTPQGQFQDQSQMGSTPEMSPQLQMQNPAMGQSQMPVSTQVPPAAQMPASNQMQDNLGTDSQAQEQQSQDQSLQDGEAEDSRSQSKQDGKRAAHAKRAQSAFMQRSSRMRKLYVAIIVLLVIIVIAIGFLFVQVMWTADNSAIQQTQVASTDLTQAGEGEDVDTSDSPKTTVPNIVELLGKTRKQAVSMIGHGAEVVSNRKVKEEGNPVRREVRIELTDEPADSSSGAPTVYLSLDKSGKVINAGYSAAISSLGYGSASFSDTVESEHIVENTLGEAGLTVESGSATLPSDATDYTSYSSDGSTVTKEYCSFSGKGTANGKTYKWEAILSYDYQVANISDNLNDTLRTIFVYVSETDKD